MSWDKGFNFRGTSGGATDGPNETYVVADPYPVTRNGVTFGWSGGAFNPLDRGAYPTDPRLAGCNYGSPTGQFRVDLPEPADFAITLAMGEALAHTTGTMVIKDNTTTRLTVGPHALHDAKVWDASDVEYDGSAWPASNTPQIKTFASTTFYLEMAGSDNFIIAHLALSQQPQTVFGAKIIFRNRDYV